MPLITFDMLQLYLRFDGDSDGLIRSGAEPDVLLYETYNGSAWQAISSALQDIDLISKKNASDSYIATALAELKANCDEKSFKYLTARIPFYADFQKVAKIVSDVLKKIPPQTDLVYTHFKDHKQLRYELLNGIEKLRCCSFDQLETDRLSFAPTSLYQEVAMAGGWSNEYLELAEQFDELYAKINTSVVTDASPSIGLLDKIVRWFRDIGIH